MSRTLADTVFIGMRGYVMALDRRTGSELWRTFLKGSGFVNVTLDGTDLFATTQGEIFCLQVATGQVRWNNPLRGMGYGLISIAGSNAQAALAEEHRRQEESQQVATTTHVTTG